MGRREPVAEDDSAHAAWVPISRLPKLEIWEKTREMVEKAAGRLTK